MRSLSGSVWAPVALALTSIAAMSRKARFEDDLDLVGDRGSELVIGGDPLLVGAEHRGEQAGVESRHRHRGRADCRLAGARIDG